MRDSRFRLYTFRGVKPRKPWDIQALEDGIDRNPLAVLQGMGEVNRATVDENEIDFDVGNAKRFDGVLDRGCARERVGEIALTASGRQEVVQLFVEAEAGLVHDFT